MELNLFLDMIKKSGSPMYFRVENGEYCNLFDPVYEVDVYTSACGAGACGACACACGACGRKHQQEKVLEA